MFRNREEFLAYMRKYNADRRAFLRDANCCIDCGADLEAETKHVLCHDCRDERARRERDRYWHRKMSAV
jgi:hypothetical protein